MSDGPQTIQDWIAYLHTAASVPKGSPDYGEARDAVKQALRHIDALHTRDAMNEANQTASPVKSGIAEALHGLSLGTGEVFSNLPGLGGPANYRESRNALQEANPLTAAITGLGTDAAQAAIPVGAGVQAARGMQAGVPLGVGKILGNLGRGAAAGGIPAGMAGFSAGGANPNDLGARVEAGGKSAALGAILGSVLSGTSMRVARSHIEKAADLTAAGQRRALIAARLAAAEARTPTAPAADPVAAWAAAHGVDPSRLGQAAVDAPRAPMPWTQSAAPVATAPPVAAPVAPSPVKTDIEQLIASLKSGPKATPPIAADRAAAAGASDLLPQDFYGSTWHLNTLLKEGNVTPEYAAAIRRELARRAAP